MGPEVNYLRSNLISHTYCCRFCCFSCRKRIYNSATSGGAVLVGSIAVVVALFADVGVVLGCSKTEEHLQPPANTTETKIVDTMILKNHGSLLLLKLLLLLHRWKLFVFDLITAEQSDHSVSFVEAFV